MKIDNNGNVSFTDRETLKVINEFDFNVETIADEIISLRNALLSLERKIQDLENLN